MEISITSFCSEVKQNMSVKVSILHYSRRKHILRIDSLSFFVVP